MHGRPKYGRGLIMSVAVFGKLSNLRIGCDHGERHFYGSVAVEASHKIEPHWLKDPKQWLEGAVHIFGQGSEECYSRLIIGGEQEQIQHLLKSFSELTSLAVVRRYKDFLAITLMLTFADFNWFSSFVEAHYVNDLEYLFHLPIVGFAQDGTIEASFPAKRGMYVPTTESFYSGKPFFIPNKSIPFDFQHMNVDSAYKYKWLKTQEELKQQRERTEDRNRQLDQVLADGDARRTGRTAVRAPRWKTAIWWGMYFGIFLSVAAIIVRYV
jgi:hypothetical protein